MKQRTGFVSNSSSSSFIVGFNKDPMNRGDFEQEMGECTPMTWDDSDLTSYDVIERVWDDLIQTDPATSVDIMRELRHSMPYRVLGEPERRNYDDYSDYIQARNKFEEQYVRNNPDMQKFLKSLEGKHVYILSYADENGEADLEHGDIFRHLDVCLAISHH